MTFAVPENVDEKLSLAEGFGWITEGIGLSQSLRREVAMRAASLRF
ncbi:MAG: hypothetical protein ACTTK0_05055 [Stomatobaculum sp.]